MRLFFAVLGLLYLSLPAVSLGQSNPNGTGQKIVIVDSGIYNDDTVDFFNSHIIDQWCVSKSDTQSEASEVFGTFNDLEEASLCIDGATVDLDSPNAAELPRRVFHSSLPGEYSTHEFGTRHGSAVFNDIVTRAFGARFIIATNAYYNAENIFSFDSNGEPILCGVHGPNNPNGLVRPGVQPSEAAICYDPADALMNSGFIERILGQNNVAAINYSAGAISQAEEDIRCFLGNSVFERLKSENIAVVAAAGNRGSSSPVEWPACNSNVIAVGALNADGTVASTTSTATNNIDFFAIGTTFNRATASTSFATPKVSAAFAVVQSAEAQVRTVDEIKLALSQASTESVIVNGRQVPVIDGRTALAAVDCLRNETCTNNSPPGADGILYEDGGQFGPAFSDESESYDFEIDQINIELPTLPQNQNKVDVLLSESGFAAKTIGMEVPAVRDIVLKFEATFETSNRMDIFINGRREMSTALFTNSREIQFTIRRDMFVSGTNSIRLQPRNGNQIWGISNIEASYTPIVPLDFNLVDQTLYGSEQTPVRPTGMRVSFELENTASEVIFAATGFQVSPVDEVEVYLNGRFRGVLDNGSPLEIQSDPNFFVFTSDLLLEGTNVVEFVQKENGVGDWGVTDILVTTSANPTSLQLGIVDPVRYGNGFGTDQNPVQLDVDFVPLTNRDHVISWRAFDIEFATDVEVLLNGQFIKTLNISGTGRFATTERLTLASRLFNDGVNTLSFRRHPTPFSDDIWGVTNLLVRESEVVNLDASTALDQVYGYYELVNSRPAGWQRVFSNEEHQTRLYATFENTARADRLITLQGWDIDDSEELGVYLNDDFLQFVSSTGSSTTFGAPDRIRLPKENLILGQNTLSLRRRDNSFPGFQGEKWGIRFINLTRPNSLNGAVAPIINLVLSDD